MSSDGSLQGSLWITASAGAFITTGTTAGPSPPLSIDDTARAFLAAHADGTLDRHAELAETALSIAIPAGERYAVRCECVGHAYAAACGWKGARMREAGSDVVPACPECGGLTEPSVGSARLRLAG